jgi:hypothetical protein
MQPNSQRLVASQYHHNFWLFQRHNSNYKKYLSTSSSSTRSRLAIGGSKLSQTQQDGIYPSVIATALQNDVLTFESGLHGDGKLKRGFVDAVMFLQNVTGNTNRKHVELTARFGYRTAASMDDKIDGDILQESNVNENSSSSATNNTTTSVFHNMSSSYIQQTLEHSPLVSLYQGKSYDDNSSQEEQSLNELCKQSIDLTYMAHNPEAQGSEMHAKGAPIEDTREFTKEKMKDAFIALERGVEEGLITSYGVCSNGLSLPSSHPLHLSWEDMLDAASHAAGFVHQSSGNEKKVRSSLSMIQLPINLLETHGLKVANRIKEYVASPPHPDNKSNGLQLPSSIRVFAMRPLTCYPDRGTGTGYPFKLVDYLIPNSLDENDEKMWTHHIETTSPPLYNALLNETMAHFDATHILEIKEEEERSLTTEERETLDGCKLLQSMIHDLDVNLSSGKIRSFAAYEEELYSKAIPLIHDTFEELDTESAELLQRFFHVHGNAVRHSIAKTTRKLLKEGGDGVDKYEIPDEVTLQEFALGYLLKQTCDGDHAKGYLIDKVVVGCPKAEHVVEAVKIADKIDI